MNSDYQQKKMMNALGAIDTKGNIVLEQFQDGTALLFQPGNAQPFCVATDYDRATASWSYGKHFSDLGCAHEAADPEIIEDASVRWVKEDIREKLKAQAIEPTEFNVQSVIMGDSRLWERPLDRDFRDNMIASGNDDLDARVTILKENGNFRSVDTAMPVASLDELEQYRSDRLPECGYLFRDNGYRIKVFNTIEFNKSMHYNPLKYVKTDADILSFVNCLISNTNGDKQSGGDPFWENSERLLYTALIALLRDWFPPEDYSLDGLLTLLSMAEAKENDENFKSPLDMIFDEIETGKVYERNPFYQGPSTSSSYADAESDRMAISENTTDEFTWQSSLMERNNDGLSPAREGGLTSDQDFALANYKMFKVAAGKTLKSIIISCNVRMAPMRIEQVRELLKYDEMNLDEMGDPGQRTAVFAIMSDTDKTFSFLHAIMMWQSIDILCRRALEKYNGKLPTMVNFIFDEFANIGTIPDIEQTIAVTRSRNIGISIILQSVAQLESRYDKKAKTIIDCCDTTLFLGGKSNSTNKEISEMIGKQTINQKTFGETRGQSGSSSKNIQIQGRDLIDAAEIGKMNRREAILLIAGTNPLKDLKYPVEQHPNYIYLDPGRNKPGQVKNRCLYDEPFNILEYMDEIRTKDDTYAS